ncbi:Dabb family protein [Paenibacillus chitinolyticus]|uniref:Dabb family protein n=1 Tax=Paenibacillus chitinolyticus TaxID=79263 RepID=UPI0036DE30D5
MSTIRHLVLFNLKHEEGSAEAEKFLSDGRELLASIPQVQKLQVLRQISLENDYQYAFSMEFSSQSDYDEYSAVPRHIEFVEQRWLPEVVRSFEADFEVHG